MGSLFVGCEMTHQLRERMEESERVFRADFSQVSQVYDRLRCTAMISGSTKAVRMLGNLPFALDLKCAQAIMVRGSKRCDRKSALRQYLHETPLGALHTFQASHLRCFLYSSWAFVCSLTHINASHQFLVSLFHPALLERSLLTKPNQKDIE